MPSHAHIPGCARLNVARLNAFRLNYAEPIALADVGGVDRTRNVRIEGATVQHVLNDGVDTASVRVHGFAPVAGQTFALYVGDRSATAQIFGGRVLETTALYESKHENVAYDIQGIDPTWLLNRRRVLWTYVAVPATPLILDLMSRWGTGFTVRNVALGLPVVDEITFTNETVAAALSAICERIGAYWYVDYAHDLHVFLNEATSAYPISDADPRGSSQHTLSEDLSQVVTRVIARGGGGSAVVDCAASATELPLDDDAWFSAAGGVAEVAGNQRVTYAGVRGRGGSGALVGTGTGPSSAAVILQGGGPAPNLIVGATYRYALTYVTATGETMPGPVASGVPSGQSPPNPVQPTFRDSGSFTGGGSQPTVGGVYRYRLVFSFDGIGGCYGISPTSNPITYNGNQFEVYLGTTSITPDGIVYFPELHPGFAPPTARYAQIWIDRTTAGGATFYSCGVITVPVGPGMGPAGGWFRVTYNPSDADLIAGGPSTIVAGPPFAKLTVDQLPTTGNAAVTARKLYRTAANGAQLKLLTTLASPSQTQYQDQIADASLGANAPTTDTAGIPADTGKEVQQGSTTLIVSTTTPFEADGGATGGWVRVGAMPVRYTGIGSGQLTGIPATGVGSITATVRWGTQALVHPRLVGVVSLLLGCKAGDGVVIRLDVDDVAAQAALATRLGFPGSATAGVVEEPYSNSRMTLAELADYAAALLADRKDPRRTVRFKTRDDSCDVGRTVTISLTTPPISGVFRIQRVTFSEIAITGALARTKPLRTVEASNKLFTFTDLLRRLRGREGGAD